LHGDALNRTHGREKALQTPRPRQLVASGIPLALTADDFRAAVFNPWLAIGWAVCGRSVAGTDVLAEDDGLPRAEALNLFTRGAALFMNAETGVGMLVSVSLAEFALLNRDDFTVREDEIKSITSVLTVMDGKVVFGAQEYGALAPTLPDILPECSPLKPFGGCFAAE
jgi:predicted amidohydrolase YtcJ